MWKGKFKLLFILIKRLERHDTGRVATSSMNFVRLPYSRKYLSVKTVNAHIFSVVNRKQKFLPAAYRTPRLGPNRKPQTHSIHGPLNGLQDMA